MDDIVKIICFESFIPCSFCREVRDNDEGELARVIGVGCENLVAFRRGADGTDN